MSRILLTGLGGLVWAAAFWSIFVFWSASILVRTSSGPREETEGVTGAVVTGPVAAMIGLAGGGYIVWQTLADAAQAGSVALAVVGGLIALAIGVTYALLPTSAPREDFGPGVRPDFEIEVRFPAAEIEILGQDARIAYQLRSGDGTVEAEWKRDRIRREDGYAIVPASFKVQEFLRTKLFALLMNERQRVTATIDVESQANPQPTWSEWQDLNTGLQLRHRIVMPGR
ncbi:hypothetical protein [Paludibaculum fermentans]|uniref:hypothetical protein n=1 Tax=Paludibaculum fermentans TaxID=1473598 RepID=UPI003EBE82FB